ncbi:MAG: helix-turn-helix domain-containing protein [Leptolyngbyaceae cyanobacterium]
MESSEAFRRTLFEFRLSGAELSRRTGVSKQQISTFKNGRQGVSTYTLDKLLDGMPPLARKYFCELLARGPADIGLAAERPGHYPVNGA